MSAQHGIGRGDRIVGDAERYAERMIGLVTLFGGGQKCVPGPFIGELLIGRRTGRVHLGQIEPDIFFEMVDPGAGRQGGAADRGRHSDPMALLLGHRGDALGNLAVCLDQLAHDVVERCERVGLRRAGPSEEGQHVVPGPGLRLGRAGQQQLVALRGDVVDRDVDLFLRAPLLAQFRQGVVGAGHPMVPEAEAQAAGGIGAVHERRGQRGAGGRRGGGLQYRAAGKRRLPHVFSLPALSTSG